MFLTRIMVNTGGDPDGPRPGHDWLRNIYHVHQRLCMAFPTAQRKAEDADFLKPYNPADFALSQVHVNRSKDIGFLFRIDPYAGGTVIILVQSATMPDWDYAFHNAEFLLAAPPQVKECHPSFNEGEILRFRLCANPQKRLPAGGVVSSETGKPIDGKRVQLFKLEDQLAWLERRSVTGGFAIIEKLVTKSGMQRSTKDGKAVSHYAVTFDGVLRVTDAALLLQLVESGIGSGKGFGFGLLSLAPV